MAKGSLPIWSSLSVHLQQTEIDSELHFLSPVFAFELPHRHLPRLVIPVLKNLGDVEIHGRDISEGQ